MVTAVQRANEVRLEPESHVRNQRAENGRQFRAIGEWRTRAPREGLVLESSSPLYLFQYFVHLNFQG